MTSILSAISGYFSKAILLGTLLPVIFFVTLSLLFLVPLFPPDLQLFEPLAALDTQWKVLAVTLVTVVLSGLLYNLNVPIIRLYEGYPWLKSRIGRRRRRHYARRYRQLDELRTGLDNLEEAMLNGGPAGNPPSSPLASPAAGTLLRDEVIRQLRAMGSFSGLLGDENLTPEQKWSKLIEEIDERRTGAYEAVPNEFPNRADLILPTKLGNRIRSFEYYSNREYGMDSIALWPRLVASINKDYAVYIDDAKISFDFMLNNSLLCGVLSASLLAAGIAYTAPMSDPRRLLLWLFQVALFAALAYWLYTLSVSRAAAWGTTIKSSFDLYRGELLKQLGYPDRPRTRQEERALWEDISRQMYIGDRPSGRQREHIAAHPRYVGTYAHSETAELPLKVARGLVSIQSPPGGPTTFVISVRNEGVKAAKNLIITDTLPDGFELQWPTGGVSASLFGPESAPVETRVIRVVGANPYHFEVGELGPGHEVVLTNHALKRGGDK
ncbi:MAG: DUF11 domain-containing protein [Acidobacteriota bacterium]|nr:DUF11 domain-containing protein [Acidobacteriota bacterium]